MKNRAEVHLDTFARPDPDAPYLLVVLEGADGEGHWGVKQGFAPGPAAIRIGGNEAAPR